MAMQSQPPPPLAEPHPPRNPLGHPNPYWRAPRVPMERDMWREGAELGRERYWLLRVPVLKPLAPPPLPPLLPPTRSSSSPLPTGPPFGGRPFILGAVYLAPPPIPSPPPPPLRGPLRPPGVWMREAAPVVGIPGFSILRDAWGVAWTPPAREWIPLWRDDRPDSPPNP